MTTAPTTSARSRAWLRLAYLALAAADTWLAGRPPSSGVRAARAVTKPALLPVLAAGSGSQATPVLAAQAASWAGDVALLAPGATAFRAGVGSFALAHVAYVVALAPHLRRDNPLADPTVRALAVTALASAPVMGLAARRAEPGLGVPVAAYSAFVTATAAACQRVDPARDALGRRLVAAGGLVFLASDTTLGTREFLLHGRPEEVTRPLERVVMATYTAAQLLLAEGFRRLGR